MENRSLLSWTKAIFRLLATGTLYCALGEYCFPGRYMPLGPSDVYRDTFCMCRHICATILAAFFAFSIAHSSWRPAVAIAATNELTNESRQQGVILRPIPYPTLFDQQSDRYEVDSGHAQGMYRRNNAGERHLGMEKEQRRRLMRKWDI